MALTHAELTIKAAAALMGCSFSTACRSLQPVPATGIEGSPRRGRPGKYTESFELKLTAFYCQNRPLAGCGRWTLRWAAAYLKANPECIGATPGKSTIQRILKKNHLKPHQSRYFLHITDPDFFPKMEHLVSLYMNPPRNLFFFDECPGIQILKRLLPDLQTETAKKRLEEFEYIRNGTMNVLAFLNYTDGKVYAECHADHKTETLSGVFRRHVAACPENEPLHYVMDNLSTHISYPFCQTVAELSGIKCPLEETLDNLSKRADWLKSSDKRIVIHFTPYHGSWLNLIEIWFGIMNRKVLTESFASAEGLKQSLTAFVEDWNLLLAHPFRWTYTGAGLHEKAIIRFTKILRDSAGNLETGTLTKQLRLMKNLLNDYCSEIPEDTLRIFIETLLSQQRILEKIIQNEDGPIKKKKAETALASLVSFIKSDDGSSEQKTANVVPCQQIGDQYPEETGTGLCGLANPFRVFAGKLLSFVSGSF